MTLAENIGRAVADFSEIKQAIIDQGIEVPSGTPTSKYGELIRKITGKGGDVKPTPAEYIQDGLELMLALDGSDSDVLTNPAYVTDDTIGRVVVNVVDGQSSFYVNKTGWDCAGADGVTLQCLAKFITSESNNIIAVGYNLGYPENAAIGLAAINGKLAIGLTDGSYTTDCTLSEGIWYHLALVYNNITKKLELYINGSQVYVTDFNGSMSSYARGQAIGTWVWSSEYPNSSSTNWGNSKVANCCFYARPLEAGEIAENFEVDKKRYGIWEV